VNGIYANCIRPPTHHHTEQENSVLEKITKSHYPSLPSALKDTSFLGT